MLKGLIKEGTCKLTLQRERLVVGDRVLAVCGTEEECWEWLRSRPRQKWDIVEPLLCENKWRIVLHKSKYRPVAADWEPWKD